MSKQKKPVDGPKAPGAVLAMRLDHATRDALAAFINAQRVPPDKTAVGLQALHEFLQREGFWPPKKAAGS